MDKIAETTNARPQSGIMQLAAAAWRHRLWFILPVVVAIVVGLLLSLSSARRSTVDVFNYTIQFNFSGVEQLEYPNGETFSLQDIIAPHVLDEVYKTEIASKFDVSAQSFRESFRISAYSPTRELIIARYDNLLSNRRISFAESAAASQKLEAALNAASRNAAVISFFNNSSNLPPVVVKASLEKVVANWIRYSIDKRGVLDVNLDVLEPSFLNKDSLEGLGQISKLSSVVEMYNKVARYISNMSKLEGAGGLVDQQSGLTIASMQSQLAALEGRVINYGRALSHSQADLGASLDGLYSTNAFDPAALKGLDPQVAFDILLDRIFYIRSNISKIEEVESGSSVPEPETGLTVVDLKNILVEIETYQIKTIRDAFLKSGVSANPQEVRAYYERRIREYQRNQQAINELAKVIENVDQRYDNSSQAGDQQSGSGAVGASVGAQLGDGFLDRVIAMSSQSQDAEFRQELARRSIELLGRVSDIENKIAGLRSDLDLFETGRTATNSSAPQISEEQASARIDALMGELSKFLGVTVKIGRRIKNSDNLIKILVDDLNLNEDDPRLSRSSFLSDDISLKTEVGDVLNPLKELVTVSNRINSLLGETLYGSRSLAASVAAPSAVRQPIMNRRSLLLFGIVVMLGVLAGMVLAASMILRESDFAESEGQA